ncbi:PVC-type heme-binding CxxCH protein [Planctomicrobium piriforme]|nr:PVC-type heme-binding CxxCH protein [Planctomicrobium piriforme]
MTMKHLSSRVALLLSALLCQLSSAADSPVPPGQTQALSPEESAAKMVLPTDCRVELVACEPDVIDPVAMSFGADGRLWVIEFSDYPEVAAFPGPISSRISVLTDPEGDGRYGNARVFAKDLLLATGLMPWKDGLIVTANGEVIFLADTNGDGTADRREVWFRGFSADQEQQMCNAPTLGPDNKIYIASGLRKGSVMPGESNPWGLDPKSEPVKVSGMDFRFDPHTGSYEVISGVSQFGQSFDDWGNRFTCTNRHPCQHVFLTEDEIKSTPWLRVSRVEYDVSPAAEKSRVYPLTEAWTTSNLHANQFTAACGVTIFRGNGLPSAYQGNSFACEPTANLIHRDAIKPYGATFTALPGEQGKEFLASKDAWFRPVGLSHGPDGALYVCDMYRAVIEHPDFMPDELKTRPDLLYGTDKGRLWRITTATAKPKTSAPVVALQTLPTPELVKLLQYPNHWHRETAHRLLLERRDPAAAEFLRAQVQDVQSGPAASIALSLLDDLKTLTTEDAIHGLRHPHALRDALNLGQRHFSQKPAWKQAVVGCFAMENGRPVWTQSQDPQALFHLLTSTRWSDWSDAASANDPRPGILELAKELSNRDEPGQKEALVIHFHDDLALLCTSLTKSVVDAPSDSHLPESLEFYTLTLGRRNQPTEVAAVLQALFAQPVQHKPAFHCTTAALSGLLAGLPGGRTSVQQQLAALNDQSKAHQVQFLDAVVKELQVKAVGSTTPSRSVAVLALLETDRALPVLRQLIQGSDINLAVEAVRVTRMLPGDATSKLLVELLPTATPQLRRELLNGLTASPSGTRELLTEVEAGRIALLELDAGQRKAIMATPDPALRARADKLLKTPPAEDRVNVLASYQPTLSMKADARHGREIFSKNCAACHRIGGVGINIGPDISDSRTKTPDFLLTNILDPNRAIDSNYFSFTVVDANGRVFTGVITAETSNALTLAQAGGQSVTIAREEIDELKNNGQSLMPVGFERSISPQEMADLVSYIKNWRYLDNAAQ